QPAVEAEIKRLTRMLVTLSQMNIVVLDPPPPEAWKKAVAPAAPSAAIVVEAVDDESDNGSDELASQTESDQSAPAVASAPRVKPPTVDELMARLKLGEHIGTTAAA